MNPFTDTYFKKELEFYGSPEFIPDGIQLVHEKLLGRVDDYFNLNFRNGDLTALVFLIEGRLWMSLVPMEVQSAYVGIQRAFGDMATAGLGMGYFTLKCAEKDDVISIDAYERSAEVIEYWHKNFQDRKGYDKVNVIHGDVRELMRDKEYDYVWMDIYKDMCPDEAVTDISLFNENNMIGEYRFWGQEYVFLTAVTNREAHPMTDEDYRFLGMWLRGNNTELYRDDIGMRYVKKVLHKLGETA